MRKPNQSELQLDRSQLLYSEHLGQTLQEAAQPNIAKKAHHITLHNHVAHYKYIKIINLITIIEDSISFSFFDKTNDLFFN